MKKVLFLLILLTVFSVVACTSKEEHKHTITGDLIFVKEATCAEEGIAHMFCKECGEIVNTVTIHKTDKHTEVVISAIDSTCTEKGLTEGKKCYVCNEILVAQQEIPLKAHTEEIIPAIDATCTSVGVSEGKKCSSCGNILIFQQETPIIAHTYDDKYDESCNKCGFIRDAECAHREIETLKGYEATCTSTGLTDGSKCKKCGETLVSQTVISVKEHAEVVDTAVAPTCTSIGLTEGKHCSVCGEVLVEQAVIDTVDHNYVDENCQYCGVNVYLVKPKKDIAFLKQKLNSYEVKLKNIEHFIVNHSSECNCSFIETIVLNYQEACHFFSHLLYYVSYFDRTICELEYAEKIDIQKIDEINAYIEEMFTDIEFCDNHIPIADAYIYSHMRDYTTSVIIPIGVTSINSYAFEGYYNLTSITIPYSVTSIGELAFGYCVSLVSINFDGTVDQWNEINKDSFWDHETGDYTIYCTNATIAKDGTVTYYSEGLEFELNDDSESYSVTGMGTCIDSKLVIPNTYNGLPVTIIGYSAFRYCTSITELIISDNVIEISELAFDNCSSISRIEVGYNLRSFAYSAFYFCNAIENVKVDENNAYFKSIDGSLYDKFGQKIFRYAIGKTDVSFTISDLVTSIGFMSFYGSSLKSIIIPDSVTSIGDFAFQNCALLTSIIFEGTVKQWNAISKGCDWNYGVPATVVICSDGTVSLV